MPRILLQLPAAFLAFVALVPALAGTEAAQVPSTAYTWKPVTIKANGFINGVVFSPAAPDVLYIHTDMGGAYRWDAAANRWVCITDFANSADAAAKHMGVETLAVDPTDPRRAYFALGTYMSPTALMRTADGGHTWSRTDLPIKSNGNGSGRQTGERLAVDPNHPSTLFYVTRVDGLWKSGDAGVTWARVDSFPTAGANEGWGRDTGLLFVQFDRASGKAGAPTPTLYVGVFETREGNPRLYRSQDAGASWQPVPGEQPADANRFPQRCALTPDGKTLYLTTSASTHYPGPWGVEAGQIYRVTAPDSAAPTWKKITPTEFKAGASAVTLDPADPKTVYIAELGNYSPADRIWRSRDGGDSWSVLNPNAHRDDASAPYAKSMRIHWLGDLEIDPHHHDVAFLTTGYGLYRTTNLSADEPNWSFFNEGFEQAAVTEMVSPPEGPVHLISAIGDRDGYRHDDFTQSPALGQHGMNNGLAAGTCNDIDLAWRDSNKLVRVVNKKPYVQFSDDNAVTWHWMPDPGIDARGGGNAALSADGNAVVWSPEGRGSATGSATFAASRTASGWSPWKKVADHELRLTADLTDAKRFYGYREGAALQSTDGGDTWQSLSTAAPKLLTWIRAVPGEPGRLWAGGYDQDGLWTSPDGGATWDRILPGDISLAYCGAVGAPVTPGAPPALYFGGTLHTHGGVFRSDDAGKTWTEVTDKDHQYGQLICLQADPRVPGRVYLGTNGRGIVYGDPAK